MSTRSATIKHIEKTECTELASMFCVMCDEYIAEWQVHCRPQVELPCSVTRPVLFLPHGSVINRIRLSSQIQRPDRGLKSQKGIKPGQWPYTVCGTFVNF